MVETAVKRLPCCGFRRADKAMGQVYQCWWTICREINAFFFRLEYHIFYILYPFVTYLLTLSRGFINCPSFGWVPSNEVRCNNKITSYEHPPPTIDLLHTQFLLLEELHI
jgi:hypothetical protein